MSVSRRQLMMQQLPKFTVQECIDLGYFALSSEKTNEAYPIKTLKKFPYPIQCIVDFYDCFFKNKYKINNTTAWYSFELTDTNHLPIKEQSKIIDYVNNNTITREISTMLFRNYNIPDKDFKLHGCRGDYQYCHDMLKGSIFNNIYVDVVGNISSAYRLFRNITCNRLEVYIESNDDGNRHINPYNNTGEMYQGAKIKVLPRNISYHGAENNWLFAGLNYSGTEIPNIKGVETEEERIGSDWNSITTAPGWCYQLAMYLNDITKIGPMLIVNKTTNYEYLWGRCAIHFANCTDVRIKGCNNIDYDLRGGKNDTIYFPKIDLPSIKYCIENVTDQTEWNWKNKKINSVINGGYNIINDSKSLTFADTSSQSHIFTGSKFNITIPNGYSMDIKGFKKENNKYYLLETLTINSSAEISFTNSESIYAVFTLYKNNNSEILPKELRDLNISIGIYDESKANYVMVQIPNTRHTITFPNGIYNAQEVKNYVTESVINDAALKGWTVFVGETQI